MFCKTSSLAVICLLLTVFSFQPGAYAWGLSRASIGNAYQVCKQALIKVAPDMAPMIAARGIMLACEMIINGALSGAYGNRQQACEPTDVPEGLGLIAPGTVPSSLERIIRLMNAPDLMKEAGGCMWKGIVLHGGPGTGKSQLGYYIAREMGAKVMYKSAASLINEQQGSGPAAVRAIFDKVYNPSLWSRFKAFIMRIVRWQREKPVVLILDEIDAIGCKRKDKVAKKERAREAERVRTLNELLTLIDGAHKQAVSPKIFVVGTTNRPLKVFDGALIRPGRLRPKHVPGLGEAGRLAVLSYHVGLKHIKLADDVDLHELARQAEGYSGAALQELLNTAALRRADQGDPRIGQRDLLHVLHRERLDFQKMRKQGKRLMRYWKKRWVVA
jgi:SpoVK/Ycf46/Vps4 family AAA+-type ATPase